MSKKWYEEYFFNGAHHFAKAVNDTKYPTSKKDMIARIGDRDVLVDFNKTVKLKTLLEPIKVDYYESAAAFYNAYGASL